MVSVSQLVYSTVLLFLFVCAAGHGIMTAPRPRGSLKANTGLWKIANIDENAPQDSNAHFPAGDKSSTPGAGLESQKVAGGASYIPFDPYKSSFNWRAGVCGDKKDVEPQPHLKGGEFYYNGKIVQEYKAGDVVDFSASIITHHNGFFEFHICNIDSCSDDDISEGCFQQGHCQQLFRAPNPTCDSKESLKCGPIDSNFPGRWYLPCSEKPGDDTHVDVFGGSQGTMKYKIPGDLQCEHCVVLWYYAASNACQAVGVEEYFTGSDGPEWGTCTGQAGAIGGYVRGQPACGGSEFTEEYLQCADVAVTGAR